MPKKEMRVLPCSCYQFQASSASSSSSSGVRVRDMLVLDAGCLDVADVGVVGIGCLVGERLVVEEETDGMGEDLVGGDSVSVDVDVCGEWDVLSLDARRGPVLFAALLPSDPVLDNDGFSGVVGVVGDVALGVIEPAVRSPRSSACAIDCPNMDARLEMVAVSHFFGMLVVIQDATSSKPCAPGSGDDGRGMGDDANTEVEGGVTDAAAEVGVDAGAAPAGKADDEDADGVGGADCCRSKPRDTMRSHLRFSSRSSASWTASWLRNSRHLLSFWAMK